MKVKIEKAIAALEEFLPNDAIKTYEPMSRHTSFNIGGPCQLLLEPTKTKQISKAINVLKKRGIPTMIMGRGSNMLVSDEGISGAVIKLSDNYSKVSVNGNRIIARSGVLLKNLAEIACDMGLSGLEFAHGIPGNVGGAITMNAGAYSGEIKHVVSDLTLLDEHLNEVQIKSKDMDFGYRTSIVQQKFYVVLQAAFDLQEKSSTEIRKEMQDLHERRSSKQPLNWPSAGSVFKRPEGHYAGQLIDECGLRGLSYGGAQVSEKHCGFIINKGGASASDVMCLIDMIKKIVYDKKGIMLEREVRLIS